MKLLRRLRDRLGAGLQSRLGVRWKVRLFLGSFLTIAGILLLLFSAYREMIVFNIQTALDSYHENHDRQEALSHLFAPASPNMQEIAGNPEVAPFSVAVSLPRKISYDESEVVGLLYGGLNSKAGDSGAKIPPDAQIDVRLTGSAFDVSSTTGASDH